MKGKKNDIFIVRKRFGKIKHTVSRIIRYCYPVQIYFFSTKLIVIIYKIKNYHLSGSVGNRLFYRLDN